MLKNAVVISCFFARVKAACRADHTDDKSIGKAHGSVKHLLSRFEDVRPFVLLCEYKLGPQTLPGETPQKRLC